MKLIKVKKIYGEILLLTGLHIGAGNDTIEIGGIDNPVIKDPFTQEPYIPGSSIKGKMRSLYEWYSGKVLKNNGEPCSCGECEVCKVYGTAIKKSKNESEDDAYRKALKRGPTRIILRDAYLNCNARDKYNKGDTIIEVKHENKINRITAEAKPRNIERVVPGVEFDFSLVYLVYDMEDNGKEDEENFDNVVLKSLALLQENYLGGGGSRGNGRIIFKNLRDENDKPIELPKVF